MKILRSLIALTVLFVMLLFANCGNGGDDGPTAEEEKTAMLTGSWSVASVSVPTETATTDDQWSGFTVSFTETQMTTSGHPSGASAVWPSGGWSFNSALTEIIRSSDNVSMDIVNLTDTQLNVRFTIEQGTEIDSRVAELGGEYTFNLEK